MSERLSDTKFTEELRAYLEAASGVDSAVVPRFTRESGKVDREKTLALPCFEGMTPAKKESLL